MSKTKKLTDDLSVCSFVRPEELPALAGTFGTLINNRPDAEEPGQPSSAEIEAAARKLGMGYVHIPVVPGQISDAQVRAFARALEEIPGSKLAFCRTGTRSTTLWALSSAGKKGTDQILSAAQQAGYDLSALKPRIEEKARG